MLAPNIYHPNKVIRKSTRDGLGDALLELGKKNKDIVVVSADLAESTRVLPFAAKYPERFIEVGVAEQNMMGVAAGLALSGKIPVATSFAVFSPGRNWDQLRVSVCYSRANVKIVSTHTGLDVGPDGASHQALEDIAITRVLPELTVIQPIDYLETKKAVSAMIERRGPVYLRLTRSASPVITTKKSPFKIGRADVLIPGNQVTIIGCGPVMYEAILAAHKLSIHKISAEVINCHTIKPIDVKKIIASAKKTKCVVTVEDHQVNGGLGSTVAEVLGKNYPVPIEMIGVQNTFGESGSSEQLWKKYGLTYPNIVAAAKKVIKRK